ncbi:MAG: M23 family metallopeptidase [Hyphomonadaceae bacterium]
MVRILAFALVAGLAGCAAGGATYPRPVYQSPAYAPPPQPDLYAYAPRASLHSELFACNRWGSNLGEIGMRGEVVQFSPYIQTQAGSLLRLPVESACLSSGFGWRDTASGGGRQHNGLDLANPNGGYVYAAADARVIAAGWRGGYGNVVELDHGQNVRTLYAHLADYDPSLVPGGFVTSGVAIGRMGMTGNATGVHLHYEVYVDGMIVDPLHYGRPPIYVSAPAPDQPAF